MLRTRDVRRLLLRHRRVAALAGVLLALGVAGLCVHAALPDHHHVDGHTTMCVSTLVLAGLAVFAWRHRRPSGHVVLRPSPMLPLGPEPPVVSRGWLARDRAGPRGPVVLRC